MKIDFDVPQPAKKVENKKQTSQILSEKQRSEIMRGWYIHCNTFYVGYGWQTMPPCPDCGEAPEKATQGEVFDEHYFK